MKTIIAGSRNIGDPYGFVCRAVRESGFDITEIVSGTARGVDRGGEEYAKKHGIPLKRFPANWNRHGKSAGAMRNIEMAAYADALIAVWDGESKGTKHMISAACERGLMVFVLNEQPTIESGG